MNSVKELVENSFPGVHLESAIQGWVYLGDFQRGLLEYQKLESPNGKDDRWLGVCYFQRFDDMQALEAFYRAIARGEEAARVNLAHLLRFLERRDEAVEELNKVDPERLNTYDRVLFLRVKSLDEEMNGNLRVALKYAEDAWRSIQGCPEFAVIAPSVLGQLGVLYGRVGRAQRALWYLERGIQITHGLEQDKVRMKRATVLITLGRYQEAKVELDSLNLSLPTLNVEKQRLLGEVAWASQDISGALSRFTSAVEAAVTAQSESEELLCRMPLTAIHSFSGSLAEGASNLSRTQLLISDKADRIGYRFREILLLHKRGDYSTDHAISELELVASEFEEMGLLQEQGWVHLHIAELKRQQGVDFSKELDQLQALSVTLQNRAFLAREWTLLPELREVARRTHPKIAGEPPKVLEVYTLGQEKLVLGGKLVKIPLRRGVEVLAYFLEHKTVSLKKLLADIFPDEKPRSAKSYFHQFRHQLQEHVIGLEIEYDKEARLYRLKSEIDILWDVAELRAGRKMGEEGLFLPSSGNEWVELLEHSLEQFREFSAAAVGEKTAVN